MNKELNKLEKDIENVAARVESDETANRIIAIGQLIVFPVVIFFFCLLEKCNG